MTTDLLETRKGIATRLEIARRQLAEAERRYKNAPASGPERVAARLELIQADQEYRQAQADARAEAAEKGNQRG